MNLLYCLRRARDQHGDSTATYRGDQPVTWRQYWDRCDGIARFLRDLGLRQGDRMSLLLENSPEFLELYHSALMAGVIVVPMNTRWNAADIEFTLRDSGSVALAVDDRFVSMAAQLPRLAHTIYAGTNTCPEGMLPLSTSTAAHTFGEPAPQDLVGLFYTSGTTGGPKGVMLSHRNLWANALHSIISLPLRSVWLHSAPMFHLADFGAVYSVTYKGGTHCYLPSYDPELFQVLVAKYKVTDAVLVPTMLNMLLNHPSFGRYDLSSLTHVLYGASPMPRPLIEDAMRKLPNAHFRQGYGMTETAPLLTVLDHEDHLGPALTSAGKPVIGCEVRVVDALERDVPAGEIGEIIARGANVMEGYWNRPEITADVLRGGWMHTGDLGRFDENGFLYILDRKKDMIKPGGENVYSPEVESAIMGHPDVLEAAVIGMPHEKWGETIRACVALRNGAVLTEGALIEWCRERMTHFKCPTSVVFVESLPKGGTGKVQKNVLRERYGT
jgi:long-chain acyl-CoA synthetase